MDPGLCLVLMVVLFLTTVSMLKPAWPSRLPRSVTAV